MKRNEAIELLEKYNDFLQEESYVDSDIWCEEPTALDKFLRTKWAKENLPLALNITTVGDINPYQIEWDSIPNAATEVVYHSRTPEEFLKEYKATGRVDFTKPPKSNG